jgi:uncharacterized protein YicC (UPF0701 family)
MTSEIDEFRKGLVAAVQAELERHASAVVAEVDRLREDGQRERAEMRREFREHIAAIASAVEQTQAKAEAYTDQSRSTIEQRISDAESRQTRRIDDATSGLDGVIAEAVRPVVGGLRDDYEAMSRKVDGLDTNLRKFDEQAARMVTYFNEMTQAMEQRTAELSEQLQTNVEGRLSTLTVRFDESESSTRRMQTETTQMVAARLSEIEDRLNERVLAAEVRVKEDAGTRIADIDAHVGRVTAGLDTTLTALNDRMAGLDGRFDAIDDRMATLRDEMSQIDSKELDELKEKMSTAIGEAVLVRIDMERLEKSLAERFDTVALRVTDVESQLADNAADVGTSVQLERLEELERAVIEIDPSKFVTRSEFQGTSAAPVGAPLDPPTMVD